MAIPFGKEERKRKLALPPQTVLDRPAAERVGDFSMVTIGVSDSRAEADRCISCKNAGCESACPAGTDISTFLPYWAAGDLLKAAVVLFDSNPEGETCGLICPQHQQCRRDCIYGRQFGQPSILIGSVEAEVGKWSRENYDLFIAALLAKQKPRNGVSVCIIGGGPMGVAAAKGLAMDGYDVTIYEALHRLGGVKRYGVPIFRHPEEINDHDERLLLDLSVNIKVNSPVGPTRTIDDVMRKGGHQVAIVALGAGGSRRLGIPGENLQGVYTSNGALTRILLMGAGRGLGETPILLDGDAAVIGLGNAAMDAARVLRRVLPREFKVDLIGRRDRSSVRALPQELEHAEQEGIGFHYLRQPVSFIGDPRRVCAVRCEPQRIDGVDSEGLGKPVPSGEPLIDLPYRIVVEALSTDRTMYGVLGTAGLEFKNGQIVYDPATGLTSRNDILTGGDFARGASRAVEAVGDAKRIRATVNRLYPGRR